MGRIPVYILRFFCVCLLTAGALLARPAESYFESEQFESLPTPPAPALESPAERTPEAEVEPVRPSRLPPFGRDGYRTRRLLGRARAKRLAWTDYWRRLLHYRARTFGGYRSEADGDGFFLAEDGREDPVAELDANLRAFMNPALPDGGDLRCVFPLRYKWLRRQLNEPKEMPVVRCPGLQKYVRQIKADSVSLVFASYYLNSPASMFGHTLIKLNSNRSGGTELLDYVINFSAQVQQTDQLSYVWKGLSGGYPGRFATLPYHVKVREYNDVESRDIYEYKLNLTDEEIENLVLHTVELEQTHFDYYYLDENCSYHLLSLIEVARPGVELSERFGAWVIPGETLRAVFQQEGLVAGIEYRPSLYSELRAGLHGLNAADRQRVFDLLAGEIDPEDDRIAKLQPSQRVILIDLALKALRFRKAAGDADNEEKRTLNKLLLARARLPAAGAGPGPTASAEGDIESESNEMRFSDPPHLGHLPLRANLGGGASSFGAYGELALRPGLQDLLNEDRGYAPHSELEVFNLRARLYQETGRAELEQFTLFKVVSLPRFETLSPSVSYLIDSGLRAELVERPAADPLLQLVTIQELARGGFSYRDYYLYENYLNDENKPAHERFDRVYPGYVDLQTGLTFASEYTPGWNGLRVALLGGLRGEYAPGSPALGRFGPALSLLGTYDTGGAVKFLLKASAYAYSAGAGEDAYAVEAGLRYTLARDLELRFKAGARPNWNEAGIEFAYFF